MPWTEWISQPRCMASEVPVLTANGNTIVVEHGGGDLTVELVPRKAMDPPVLNTLKVQERADL